MSIAILDLLAVQVLLNVRRGQEDRSAVGFQHRKGALPATADHLIVVKVSGKNFAAKVEDTATGCAFREKLPLTLDMTELNGNEKYSYGVDLPALKFSPRPEVNLDSRSKSEV